MGLKNQEEAKEQYAKRQEEKYSRLAQYSLDAENRKKYTEKTQEWQAIHSQFESKAAGNLGAPDDITDEWTVKVSRSGEVTDLMEYVTGKGKYKVDGKQVLLDYTEHERRVAERIAQLYGKRVQMIPRVTYPQGISTPDFRIDGIEWDLKTVSTAGKNVFYNAVKKKKRQANCFIFDVTECPLDMNEIKRQVNDLFRSTHLTFIDKVGLYKDRKMIGIYERKK